MSADIWLVDADGDRVPIVADDLDAEMRAMVPMRSPAHFDSESVNVTYNLTPVLREAGMPPWSEMCGMRAADAGRIWALVAQVIRAEPDRFAPLEPSNGWGSVRELLPVLDQLADTCRRHPDATVQGWL